MGHVFVRILHPAPRPDAGPLVRLLASGRRDNAERQAAGFRAAGASDVAVVSGPADDTPFGDRLRSIVRAIQTSGNGRGSWGLVVLGSGAIPLATAPDRRAFVVTASSEARRALANNRYSADVVGIARADELPGLPELAADNALPRWLAEQAGWQMDDFGRRRRLAIDLDSPLDLELIRPRTLPDAEGARVRDRRAAIVSVMADPRSEVTIAGRTSSTTVRWLELTTAARVRALVEERGLRAAERRGSVFAPVEQRRPRSVLGMAIEREGPDTFGAILAQLGEAAVVDTRVLLADRCGPDERDWPAPEDRFASDLLLPERIADPWLRALTASARDAAIPILLGGHTLVGPGLPLLRHSSLGTQSRSARGS